MKRHELLKMHVRLPPDVHDWLAAQAERNQSSINSEIVRSVRDAMDRQVRAPSAVDCTSADLGRSWR